MKVRVCLGNIEEIYKADNFQDALETFINTHDTLDVEGITVTEVGTFYDKNR